MNEITEIFRRIKTNEATWDDYSYLLNLDESDLKPFLELAQIITRKNFMNNLKIYVPNKKFPAISITGTECELHCEHCDGKYLAGMKPITDKIKLEQFFLDFAKNKGVGVLISGGCKSDGSVPIDKFIDSIKRVKKETNLIINTHTGLLNEITAKKLADAGVDLISFDVNMDEEVINEIYHLDKNLSEYEKAINILKKYDLNVVPHICVGLHYGTLHKELESIKLIKKLMVNPLLIVVIALIPPKKSNSKFKRPNPIDIAKIILIIRLLFPETEISLGCMRPRGNIKVDVEKLAIQAGITRIEIPSKKTLKWLRRINPQVELSYFSACCAIPEEHEDLARSEISDIKRYLKI
ncbi:MAG: radical SAM protein [Promethearchaeota archaeon]|nr:MAG: radical SAM protein [Candidatus Lokiarchaeota archaeon]